MNVYWYILNEISYFVLAEKNSGDVTNITTEYVPILLSKRLCLRQKNLIVIFLLIFAFGKQPVCVPCAQ